MGLSHHAFWSRSAPGPVAEGVPARRWRAAAALLAVVLGGCATAPGAGGAATPTATPAPAPRAIAITNCCTLTVPNSLWQPRHEVFEGEYLSVIAVVYAGRSLSVEPKVLSVPLATCAADSVSPGYRVTATAPLTVDGEQVTEDLAVYTEAGYPHTTGDDTQFLFAGVSVGGRCFDDFAGFGAADEPEPLTIQRRMAEEVMATLRPGP
jgi:hypothetical protein